MQFACWNLASCPDKMAKLQQEIDAHPGESLEGPGGPACFGAPLPAAPCCLLTLTCTQA